MTLESDIANMMLKKGYNKMHPWGKDGHCRIYYKDGHVELTGSCGFQAINLDAEPKFVSDVKECLKVWQDLHKKEVPDYDLPF